MTTMSWPSEFLGVLSGVFTDESSLCSVALLADMVERWPLRWSIRANLTL